MIIAAILTLVVGILVQVYGIILIIQGHPNILMMACWAIPMAQVGNILIREWPKKRNVD
jgi:hypothetical protein